MKKLLIIAVLALLLTGLVGTAALGSGGANSAGAGDAKGTFVYPLTPGQSTDWVYGQLDGLLSQRFFDVFVIVNTSTSTGKLHVEIEDRFILGDTMLGILIQPGASPVIDWATSPDIIYLGPVPMPGPNWALVITGYLASPGGFPAGYYYSISL